MMVAPSIG